MMTLMKIYTILMDKLVKEKSKPKIYLCSPKKFDGCEHLPMIKFKRVIDKLDLSDFNAIIFTSKQAVIFTDELNKEWKNKKILAVGKATAKIAKELGAKDIYNPAKFYGKELANDIVKHFSNLKMIYLRPKKVAFDSVTFLQNAGIDVIQKVIYETSCIKYNNINIDKNSIIIFTSPSTIECFFNSFKWDKSYKAIVIGKTTLKALNSDIEAFVADEQTIESCVKKAHEIINFL